MTAIKKKVKMSDNVEEDFLTASSDSDSNTNDAAAGEFGIVNGNVCFF